ncbi:uncharacterized protein PG986_005059 [Apiospora aurea]|uniref:Uncharacterized protein n=1 Tax=Apiospora aurea TaxID=335848 RepID=A0ABR1QGH1_9PEZI
MAGAQRRQRYGGKLLALQSLKGKKVFVLTALDPRAALVKMKEKRLLRSSSSSLAQEGRETIVEGTGTMPVEDRAWGGGSHAASRSTESGRGPRTPPSAQRSQGSRQAMLLHLRWFQQDIEACLGRWDHGFTKVAGHWIKRDGERKEERKEEGDQQAEELRRINRQAIGERQPRRQQAQPQELGPRQGIMQQAITLPEPKPIRTQSLVQPSSRTRRPTRRSNTMKSGLGQSGSLSQRFPGDMSHRPLEQIKREKKVA